VSTRRPDGSGEQPPEPFDRVKMLRDEYRHNAEVFLCFGIVGARWRAKEATAALRDTTVLEVECAIAGMPDEP
jgi:hypothetical protein